MRLQFQGDELSVAQKELILQAGEEHGMAVRELEDGSVVIGNLTSPQFASLVYEVVGQWGMSYHGVRVQEITEES